MVLPHKVIAKLEWAKRGHSHEHQEVRRNIAQSRNHVEKWSIEFANSRCC